MIFFYHYENLPRRYEDDVMQKQFVKLLKKVN